MSEEKNVPVINIWGEKAALGPLRRDLVPQYSRWMNDFEVARMLSSAYRPMTVEAEEAWFENKSKGSNEIQFTIYDRDTIQPIGNTGFMNIDYKNQRCDWGIFIGERDYLSKGYGTETARLMLNYGFTALSMHNISLTVFSFNARAMRAYEKAGFKITGRQREAVLIGQQRHDVILMDCLSSEFTF